MGVASIQHDVRAENLARALESLPHRRVAGLILSTEQLPADLARALWFGFQIMWSGLKDSDAG